MKKILVIIVCFKLDKKYLLNIEILKRYMNKLSSDYIVEYACISSNNDLNNYDNIIDFKYKYLSEYKQLTKISKFFDNIYRNDYHDWYIKFRPEILLLDDINLLMCKKDCINGRVRMYNGDKRIINGSSMCGKGIYENNNAITYNNSCHEGFIMDDIIYIFHNNLKDKFYNINGENIIIQERHPSEIHINRECEWYHTKIWIDRFIKFNIISIDMVFYKINNESVNYSFSGNVNIK